MRTARSQLCESRSESGEDSFRGVDVCAANTSSPPPPSSSSLCANIDSSSPTKLVIWRWCDKSELVLEIDGLLEKLDVMSLGQPCAREGGRAVEEGWGGGAGEVKAGKRSGVRCGERVVNRQRAVGISANLRARRYRHPNRRLDGRRHHRPLAAHQRLAGAHVERHRRAQLERAARDDDVREPPHHAGGAS